jgi:hypothetical protein
VQQAAWIVAPFEPRSVQRFLVALVQAGWIETLIEAWFDARPREPGPLISSLAMARWRQAHSAL